MKTVAQIKAGVCGFNTLVQADCIDGQNVELHIESDCEKIKTLSQTIKQHNPVDAYAEVFGAQNNVLSLARDQLSGCCAGCVVPAGIFKTIQTSSRLALPQEIHIKISVQE
ncbi:MAG TPA: hypothetical protein PKW76_12175 [bacterium]|nr:hypothetical protein [bacterium]HPG46429.1 hypothetical protein [bacterium]HPM98658.1 hypothetical protein [bacterium]